ncbi:MAG TPA: alpha/beta fold hydrolase [Solirubrobacterales bacterium]|jgi:nucleoside-diphosphate-sugar epimerase/pimeloyl-ACP methyl ester carboxylesterase|nr:alpha/beta fold hydrolase [Solirubrobacterales bacterium]
MKVVVSGAGGDFGTAILRRLLPDDRVDEVVGIDVVPPRLEHDKLRAERCDVRAPAVREHLDGAEAVVHLAFVLVPGRDLRAAHEVNLEGSRNVLEASAAAGAARLVVASSLSAYGAPEPGLDPVDEDAFPAGTPERFYFREKAQVEHLLDWWERAHPDSPLTITRMRPGFVYGPDFDNPALALMGSPLAVLPDDDGRTQLIHQNDLARAFCKAVFRDVPGPFLLVTDDSIAQEDFAEISGGRVVRVPVRATEVALDAAHALRLAPVSSEWAVSGDRVGRLGRARDVLGWEPTATSRESAYALLLQRGRPVRYLDGPPRREVLEHALEVMTDALRTWSQRVPGMAGIDVDAAIAAAGHEFISHRRTRVQLEVHEAGPGDPTVVLTHGIGAHARLYTPLAARLREAGFNAVVVDRPGHGLSEGRRGDCPVERALDVLEAAVRWARSRYAGPVVLGGSSLGGILAWYAITREPDVDGAFCHFVGHPALYPDAATRLKLGPLRALARVAPSAPVPVKQVADFGAVAEDPEVRAYWADEVDGLYCFRNTARTVAGLFEFRPPVDWSGVEIPTLVVVGAEDRMTTPEYVERVLERSAPPRTTYRKLAGAAHLLPIEALDTFAGEIVAWARETLAVPSGVEA